MQAVSFIVLILLSFVGYSAGAVGKAGRFIQLKPRIIDLILIAFIWSGAVYARIVLDFNKWLIIIVCVILSVLIGILAVLPRKLSEEKDTNSKRTRETSVNLFKTQWQEWTDFSKRIGSFQSRIILSLFFFIFVSPFALFVKVFSDPLNIRYRSNDSYWHRREEISADLAQFRRQH